MADLGKQFLDTDGLNALWTKHKKVQPFYQELGTSGTNGWVNFLTVKATTYMNHPLVVRLLCRGYSDSTMDVQFVSVNNTTPAIQYFKQRIQPYSGTQAIPKPGYTYEDVDGVRYYKFWLKKNEWYGSIGVHVESEYFYTTGAEDTGILTFPNVQSNTEPAGIVYVNDADIVYEAVPAKTAVSASAVKVGTNAMGQVVLGNALTKTDVGLGNVDNTSDANKPISTATQKALDGKVSKAGDTMTGPLVNTSNTENAIKVSHGAANTMASVLAERTDTGVSVSMGVGSTGSDHGVYSNKNANWIIRADGSGNVFVNDSKATSTVHIGNSDVGSTTKPVYIDDGVIKAGSTYAGGTAVTLNGTSASGSTASFYAPTGTGTNRRLLRSNGSGAPTWQIPASDYVFYGPTWNTSGDTHTFWAFRLKGITAWSYNNVLLSFDSYFWNNQKSTSDLIWIGWSNNGNQGFAATAGRVRVAGKDGSGTPLEYYLVKNKADTAADCTVDLYIRPSLTGNSYGTFYVNVLNSGNLDLDTIIEQKGTYNVDLPEGAIKIPYAGTIGSADRLSTKRELAVGLGNTSTTTKFDGSSDVTNIRVTGTLPVANGGTGATTPAGAQFNLIDKATTELGPMMDANRIAIMSPDPTSTNSVFAGYRTGLTMWNYMKGKMSSDTGVNISGNAATATSAGKLTTGRELAVGLSNTSTTTTFDGSANVTNIKVSGQLPVSNGGTGSNTAAGARTNLSVYSKSEIDSLMSGRVEIVTELPDTGKSGITYYVGPTGSGADKYDEYIWTGSAFLKVGEHSLDLSNYVNTVATSGSGSVVTGVSKSGNTVTVTKGNISLDDLSDWATETDVTISNVTYHTMWPVAPTSSNQVYGISINNGRLFRIYNNKGAYSVQAYDKDSDTTYTPQKLGIGYGTCTTAEATAAKVVTLADYTLVKNGIVAVKFSYPLCASATLNINGKGAKPVYVGGAAVTATNCKSVQSGDIGYFIYDGTAYHFLGTDRVGKSSITGLSVSGRKVTYTRADGETGSFDTQDTTYAFADGYNASTNKGATVATVTNAINALDVSDISGFGAGKTLDTLKEENGKISATFQNISITKSQVSDFSHTHGNIQNGGTLQTNDITIANGDKLVVTDASDSNKVARASLTFDGATTNQMLSKKGEWSDTIAKARGVVDYGTPAETLEIGWGGASVTSPTYFAVYTDSPNGYNKAIKDCKLTTVKKAINGTSVGSTAVPVFINANGEPQVCTDDFVHDDEITKMVQVSTAGTAVGSNLQPVYVNSSGVATAGMYSSWESLRGTNTWLNALPVSLYRSSGSIPLTSGTTPQYVRFYGLETLGMVDFWVNVFAPNSPMAIHFTMDFTSSGPGTISIRDRTGYTQSNIEWLRLYTERSGSSVRGLIMKIVNSDGTAMKWRSTGNITSSNYAVMTESEYTTFIAGYNVANPVVMPNCGGFVTDARNLQRKSYEILDRGDVTSTYSSTGTAPVNGTAVAAAIGGLDSNKTSTDGTNVQVKVTETDGKISAVNVTTDNTENKNNKVSSWQTTPDNTHYPSEKLVKDGLDGKVSAYNAVAFADATYRRTDSSTDGDWFKIASLHPAGTFRDALASFDLFYGQLATEIFKVNVRIDIRLNGNGTVPTLSSFITERTSRDNFGLRVVTRGTVGNCDIELWVALPKTHISMALKMVAGSDLVNSDWKLSKDKTWTFYSSSNGGTSIPVEDASSNVYVYETTKSKLLYAIPGTGIPKTVLESSVQASLGLADSAIQGVKVNGTTLTPDANKIVTVPLATKSADGAMSAADKTKLDGIAAGAEVNQNAFSNVKVGSTTVTADSKTDTLELASSSAITLTPDATNDKVTIGVSTMGAASSSAAGTAGIVPAPGAGKQASFLRGDGTWVVPTNTDTLVKATAKTDNVNYKILATASASPTSGNATEAVYDTDISLNPSTNTITSNISGNAATATTATNYASSGGIATALAGKADKANITGATKTKITYNSQGIVTAGADLAASDIPSLAASKITSGTFGTARIADDAITAAKVKDNETLPVNISKAAAYPTGFNERITSWSWGTLTTANGYTQVTDWHTSNGSDISFAEKSGAVSVQIDGKFYQNNGNNKVLDTADVSVPSTVPTLAWNTESTLATIDGKNIKVKLPASPDTDVKVTQTVDSATTGNLPLLAKNTTGTATITDTSRFAAAISMTPSTGTVNATQYKVNEHCTMKYNSTKSSLDFTFS